MTIGDAYERMLLAMEDVVGDTLDTTHPRRTETQYWMRTIIAQHLWQQGWKDWQIARVVGRSRCTVNIERQRYREAMELPRVYADVVRLDNNFKTRYYEFFGQDI